MASQSSANERDTPAMLQTGKPPAGTKGSQAHLLIRPGARVSTWLCALLLAILSLAPDDWLLRSNEVLDIEPIPFVEHGLAYFLTGTAVAIGYAPRYQRAQLILSLVVCAAILELGQYLTPDRSPGLAEFGAGALGALCGVFIGEKISAWMGTRERPA